MAYIPANAKWYLADIVVEFSIEGERDNVVHTNVTLVRADSPEEAYERAWALGEEENRTYTNPEGQRVDARFRGLRDLNVIYGELDHGTELIYDSREGMSEIALEEWISPKSDLGVFKPNDADEGVSSDEGNGTSEKLDMRLNRAMIFVKDLNRMVEFYATTLGLRVVEETRMENWVEFEGLSTKFSLHAIPSEIARQIEISSPPKPRETNPIKLSFEVDNVEFERRRLESLGVTMLERPWGAYDGVDPEGNIFGIYAVD